LDQSFSPSSGTGLNRLGDRLDALVQAYAKGSTELMQFVWCNPDRAHWMPAPSRSRRAISFQDTCGSGHFWLFVVPKRCSDTTTNGGTFWRLHRLFRLATQKSETRTACFRWECPPTAHFLRRMGTKHLHLTSLLPHISLVGPRRGWCRDVIPYEPTARSHQLQCELEPRGLDEVNHASRQSTLERRARPGPPSERKEVNLRWSRFFPNPPPTSTPATKRR
jgi:hypothetical protein